MSSLPYPGSPLQVPLGKTITRAPTLSSFTTTSFGTLRTDGGLEDDTNHSRSAHPYTYLSGILEPDMGRSTRLDLLSANLPDRRTSAAPSVSHDASASTLACAYMVFGLPKTPQCWTLAQPDHLPAHLDGAVPRFWRPEVLGSTVTGQDADLLGSEWDTSKAQGRSRRSTATSRKASRFRTMSDATNTFEPGIGKEDLARIQAKAMKLAFPREVEVIASTVQPPSTTHCFSFVVPPASVSVTDATGAIGQEWDLALAGASGSSTRGRDKTFYGACLMVWSHADRTRSDAIRKTVEDGSRAKSVAIAKAVKAASAGRKFGAKLEKAAKSPMGILPSPEGLAGRNWGSGAGSTSGETDTETEAFYSDSEWEGPASTMPVAQLPVGTPFWLPYCLVLVSRHAIYDLMVDHLKISWARYHQAIGKHSQQMLKMLNFPAPKPGDPAKMPVGAGDSQTYFVTKLPNKRNIFGTADGVDVTMWPTFKCLSLEHIISIYEIGLSPLGRVVFFSRYPVLLNIAVETFRTLLELRGWRGMCQSVVHARDVKIYLEDPGPYLLGMNSQLRPIAADPPPEVMIVDLDTNSIHCPTPHPHALTRGHLRMRLKRRLAECIGTFGGMRGVPSEFHEAFPGGRFRPFSEVEIKGKSSLAERLVPPLEWTWNQARVISAFDNIISEIPRRGLAKIFRRRAYRQAPILDASARHVQDIVRRHASGFVDRRDMLETKIWKLNRRLTFLMSESMEWKSHFDTFQRFTDRLSVESQELKTRLEKERRDHKRLSGVVTEQKVKQAELENRLLETEKAWMAAQVELAKAHEIREEVERAKEILVTEMKSIALGGEDGDKMFTLNDIPSRPGTASSNHASLTTRNLRRLSTNSYRRDSLYSRHHQSFMGEEEASERDVSDEDSEASETGGRAAVIDSMRGIQARLESALRSAGQLDEEELRGYDVGSPTNARSRISHESHESRVIPLQRGRRKPLSCYGMPGAASPPVSSDVDSSPRSPNGVDSTSDHSAPVSPDGIRRTSLTMNGGNGMRRRAEARVSAVSLLTPGQSIFDQPDSPKTSRNRLSPVPDDESEYKRSKSNHASTNIDDGGDSSSFVSAESNPESAGPNFSSQLGEGLEDEEEDFEVGDDEAEEVAEEVVIQSGQHLTPHMAKPRHRLVSVTSEATVRGRASSDNDDTITVNQPRKRQVKTTNN